MMATFGDFNETDGDNEKSVSGHAGHDSPEGSKDPSGPSKPSGES